MKNFYKRILIMFVMVLTIMSVGIIKNEIVANAATVGKQLLQPEEGWKRYDDINENISYKELYLNNYEQLDNKTRHYNNIQGSSFSFNFYGTKIRFINCIYSTRSKNVEIKIDGETEICSNQYSPTLNTTQALTYEKTGLELGVHTVKVTLLDNYWMEIDAIDIDEDGYLSAYNEDIKNKSLSLNKSSLNLIENSTNKLIATTTPAAVDIDWSSSDETVATVDSNGNVKAIKEGQSTITAKIKGTDIKSTCIVTVTKKDTVPEPVDPEQEYIINTANAKGDNTNNASGSVSIKFNGTAETTLSVVKTADVKEVWVGDTFTYTIVVTNTGSKTAKAVVINDSAPNHIDFIVDRVTTTKGKIDESSTSKNIVINVGDIEPSETVTIKIPVNVVV